MNTTIVDVKNIVEGVWYHLKGDIQNGDYVTKEEVTRKVTRITDKHIICECGRKFIINENLVITNSKQLW